MNQKQKSLIQNVIIVVFIMIIIVNVNKCVHRSTIWISDLPEKEVFFNSTGDKLKVSNPDEGISKLKQKLEPNEYILYYDENPAERWYATMRLKKGENEVDLKFRKHTLPHIKKELILEYKTDDIELGNRSWRYSIYNSKNSEIFYDMEINFSLRGKLVGEDYAYTAKWWLDKSGSKKSKEQINLTSHDNLTFTIYEDGLHRIDVNLVSNGNTASFEMNAVFTKYANKK
ncbi:MAG: hypothetical protein Q7J16_07080 [Candidatus Cloacimonadales bacterium]|nr:hypothetical protein [Candidatus Cloacimonadales bacterium]